jgi:putative transposase
MPSRNIVKVYAPHAFYHVYNRGVNRQVIFEDDEDFDYFTSLFKRHLQPTVEHDSKGREYPHYRPEIDLLAYCLMPNHFHLLVYQKESADALVGLMRSIATAYTLYFNKRHNRRGPLFESHYLASMVQTDRYLQHISRYIHLNHSQYKQWSYSSYPIYEGQMVAPSWLDTGIVLGLFDSKEQYTSFVHDYEDAQRSFSEIKKNLAGY